MRVTNRATTRNYLSQMNKALTDQANISNRLGSQNRFERISDDVSSGVQAMKARTELSKTEKHLSTVSTINDQLSAAEDSLTAINDLLAEIRPKIQKALTGSSSETDRKILADEIGTMKKEILELANTRFSGQYLFGGTNNYQPPFSVDEASGQILYNSVPVDDIQRDDDGTYFYMDNGVKKDIPMDDDIYLDIGMGVKMTGPGVDAQSGYKVSYSGLDIMGWGTDADGLSNNLYNVLTGIEKALTADPFVKDDAEKLDTKLSKLTDTFRTNITDIGSRSQFLDTMETRLQNIADNLDSKISHLTGTDFAEESIHQATNVAVLNAIYRLGSNVIPMSLMNFLS